MKKMKELGVLTTSLSTLFCSVAMAAQSFTPTTHQTSGDLTTGIQDVLGIIQTIAIVVAIVMVMYVGVKYLTAGAGKKAEAKEVMVPVLIGAVLVALAPAVVGWLFGALGM